MKEETAAKILELAVRLAEAKDWQANHGLDARGVNRSEVVAAWIRFFAGQIHDLTSIEPEPGG